MFRQGTRSVFLKPKVTVAHLHPLLEPGDISKAGLLQALPEATCVPRREHVLSPPAFPPSLGSWCVPLAQPMLQVSASGVTSPPLVIMPQSLPPGWKCSWKWRLVAELCGRGGG